MMRSIIKRASPDWVLRVWFSVREYVFLRQNSDTPAKFSKIYAQNIWRNGESLSGFGSTLEATEQARVGLEKLIAEHGVASILDVPSGDFNWMRTLNFSGQYTGGDIVAELAAENQRKYGDERHRFLRLDLNKDELPKADLVLCRECLNHLSLSEAQTALKHLEPAAQRFLVITHYPAVKKNLDQPASFRYRPLNFTAAPLSLRQPDHVIDETRSDPGKYLAVWDLRNGPLKGPVAAPSLSRGPERLT